MTLKDVATDHTEGSYAASYLWETISMNQPTKTSDPWVVFNYEADMFLDLCTMFQEQQQGLSALPQVIQNAVVESMLLHIRQLADIVLSKSKSSSSDDIVLAALIQSYRPSQLDEFRQLYGDHNTPSCPCWTINKVLAHATSKRSSSYDYTPLVSQLAPILKEIVQEIRGLKASGDHD